MRTKITMKVAGSDLQAVLMKAATTGVGRAADVFVRRIKESFVKTSWFNPSPVGGPPGTVTGRLRNSIQKTPPQNGETIIGTNQRYARIHEYGGVLKPTTKKYLTIPVSVAAAKMRSNTGDLRTQNLTFRKGPNRGVAFLFRTIKGKNARSELMFVLKRSVRMPSRPFLRPATTNQTWRAQAAKAFGQGFNSEIRKIFKAAAEAGAPVA
jgi:phage gpG-like protein